MVNDIDSQPDGALVSLQVVNFSKGVRYARQIGATFDGATKIWTVKVTASNRSYLRGAASYGLKIVSFATPVRLTGSALDDEQVDDILVPMGAEGEVG